MLDAGVLPVGVLHGVLVGLVRGDLGRNLFGDDLADLVAVLPVDVAELVVERLQDVGQVIKLRLRDSTATLGRDRTDLGVLVRQSDLHRRLDSTR